MNELLQKHGCSNVFTVPEGLKELMADITREVLRDQPYNILDYIANYLSILLITREHGVLAVKILDDLCDCKPSVADHLVQLDFDKSQAEMMAGIIKLEIEANEPIEGKEKVKETQILKKILGQIVLDEDSAAKVCQVARNAYHDYWYRKKLFTKHFKVNSDEPWEVAASRTLELYKRTKPSFSELTRAAQKIQAAYRGYHLRRNILKHLVPKEQSKKKGGRKKKQHPKVDLPGPPLDVAMERDIDLGPVIDIKVKEDNVNAMFDEHIGETLGLKYNPKNTITHVDEEFLKVKEKTKTPKNVTVEAMFHSVSDRERRSASNILTKPTHHSSFFQQARKKVSIDESAARRHRKSSTIEPSVRAKTAAHFYHRISFAEYPAELIKDDTQDDVPERTVHHQVRIVGHAQVPEFRVQDSKSSEHELVEIYDFKVPEEIVSHTDDIIEDVAEDIQGDHSAADDRTVESDLTATSVATDNATDPEDTDDELPEEQILII